MKIKYMDEVQKLTRRREALKTLLNKDGLAIGHRGNNFGDYYGHVEADGSMLVFIKAVIDTEISVVESKLRAFGMEL